MKDGKRGRSKIKLSLLILLGVVITLLTVVSFINLSLPSESPIIDRLSPTERIRIAEATHLQQTLGDRIWPGWGQQSIPILLFNEETVFLTGMDDSPADGWIRVPYKTVDGSEWEKIPGPQPYYRQPLPKTGKSPQAFIVKIGDDYVASMTTKDWTKIHLMQLIKDDLPNFLKPVMPYSLIINRFDSDWHITAILHESFHAFQARKAYDRVKEAEDMNTFHDSYPWDESAFREAWLKEREFLAKAMNSSSLDETEDLIREWLKVRNERRSEMDPSSIQYEKEREWLEGTAKYAEMNSWKLGSKESLYTPLTATKHDPDFEYYLGANDKWEQEIRQLKSDLNFSESTFYYTGWAQAQLLDKVYPAWKEIAFENGVYLDELLANI